MPPATSPERADSDHATIMSCQHALSMGMCAGGNAARDLLGLAPLAYTPPPYVTCLDLGPWGALFTSGWDRVPAKVGAEAKALKWQINTEWIYPPLSGRRADVLAAGKPRGRAPRCSGPATLTRTPMMASPRWRATARCSAASRIACWVRGLTPTTSCRRPLFDGWPPNAPESCRLGLGSSRRAAGWRSTSCGQRKGLARPMSGRGCPIR